MKFGICEGCLRKSFLQNLEDIKDIKLSNMTERQTIVTCPAKKPEVCKTLGTW